jgi:hypothetical protein
MVIVMKKVATAILKIRNFRNAEHFQVYWAIISWLQGRLTEVLPGLVPLWGAFVGVFEREDELFKHSRAFENTERLVAKNRARDDDFREIDYIVKRRLHSGNAEEQAAAGRLRKVMELYRDTPAKPYAENTALVTNLVQELTVPAHAEAVAALGLSGRIESLAIHNLEFDALYAQRTDEHSARENAGKLKFVRLETDAAWRALAEAVNAFYIANEYGEASVDLRVQLDELIDGVNGRIAEAEAACRRRHHSKNAAREEGGFGGE